MSDVPRADVETLIATVRAAIAGRVDTDFHLVGLAERVAERGEPLRAFELAREALAGVPDARTRIRGRRLLASLLPGYHLPMMNDVRRNAAWDTAIRRAVRPGMLAYEIGTGCGMLALMAARAGAEVVTCETNEVAAALARELAARNGLGERITVLTLDTRNVNVGEHLARPADLLFCDIFADDLFGFDPLPLIADAQRRLLTPGAPVIPERVSLHAALGAWADHARMASATRTCGLDITPLADFAPVSFPLSIGDPDVRLLSEPVELFAWRLATDALASPTRATATTRVTQSGVADALLRWIRLELDSETAIEARPEPGTRFFSNPRLVPLDQPVPVQVSETATIAALFSAKKLLSWLEP